jgi:rhomboid protease GluP
MSLSLWGHLTLRAASSACSSADRPSLIELSIDRRWGTMNAPPLNFMHPPASYREVYRSRDIDACEQRAFVLRAVGIEHVLGSVDGAFVLFVASHDAPRAAHHLGEYEAENLRRERPEPPLRLHGFAGTAALAYALVLVAIAYLAGAGAGGRDWFEIGALTPALTGSGEWWRVITALTLHSDAAHLLGNLAFGAVFGYFAAQLMGAGSAWLSILLAGALGNWIDSAVMPDAHRTIGASTAVFATLGMVAAYAWRQRTGISLRWAHRVAPLVAAVALLALTGTGGERTDVVAHLTGFGSGALLGLLHASPRPRRLLARVQQRWAAIIALVVICGAWGWAFAAATRSAIDTLS